MDEKSHFEKTGLNQAADSPNMVRAIDLGTTMKMLPWPLLALVLSPAPYAMRPRRSLPHQSIG